MPIDKFTECIAKMDMICGHLFTDVNIEDIWTEVYPDDPMSFDDFGYFLWESATDKLDFNPYIPDDVENALHEFEELGYKELTDRIREYLKEY